MRCSRLCKRDLDAANLLPALEQGCRKQTQSARKLFFRANLLYVPDIKMCPTLLLASGKPQRNGKIRFFLRRNIFFFG